MQLADRSPTAYNAAPDNAAPQFTGANQQVYLRLKLAFSLNLRRQIFLAVCDDLALRNRIAARLYAELAYPPQTNDSAQPPLSVAQSAVVQSIDRRFLAGEDGHSHRTFGMQEPQNDRSRPNQPAGDLATVNRQDQLLDASETEPPLPITYPRLVSLNLNMSNPNPMVQIANWLAQYPPPKNIYQHVHPPGFQILGTERLTRQSAPTQKRFLSSLQEIEHYLSCLESAVLLWLPRPWLHAVQQSAPAFWDWHTALFEFEGDPTPVPTVNMGNVNPGSVATRNRLHAHSHESVKDAEVAEGSIPDSANRSPEELRKLQDEERPTAVKAVQQDVSNGESRLPTRTLAAQNDNFWQILTEDLAQLDDEPVSALLEQAPSKEQAPSDVDRATPSGLLSAAQASQAAPSEAALSEASSIQSGSAETSETSIPTIAVDAVPLTDTVATPVAPSTPVGSSIANQQVQTTEQAIVSEQVNTPVVSTTQASFAPDLLDLVLADATRASEGITSSKHAQAIQALQHIDELHVRQAPRAALAAAYQSFGTLYRDRIEQGDTSEQTLTIAIRAYEYALEWLDESSPLWSDVLNDIGNLYWMRSRGAISADLIVSYLEQAIEIYQQALTQINPETRPQSYAMIQNNLGSAYGDLARYRNPAEMLLCSVQAYEAALRHRTLESDPARYAATHNNLGTTYWNLAQHQQPVLCLQKAVLAYGEALRYYSPQQEPMHYAMIQNNLGTAFWNLAQQEQATKDADGRQNATCLKLLLRAIAAYRGALIHRTLEVAPAAYAATQNNLGTAHWHIATLSNIHPNKRREQLQQAIAAYKSALAAIHHLSTAVVNAPALTFDQFATHNNLGLAYYQLAIDKHLQADESTRISWLESALDYHTQALQGWQKQPELYQSALSYVIQTIRSFYSDFGTKGQNLALSRIPANLLPEVLKRL